MLAGREIGHIGGTLELPLEAATMTTRKRVTRTAISTLVAGAFLAASGCGMSGGAGDVKEGSGPERCPDGSRSAPSS